MPGCASQPLWRQPINLWLKATSLPPEAMLLTSDRQRDAIPLGVCEFGKTRCGVSTAGLSSPFGGTSRAEAEHELAQPRPVFGPLPACRSRDVAGYYLRMHPKAETGPVEEDQAVRRTPARSSVAIGTEQAEKPLPTQAHTRRSSAARTAFTHAPLERRSCHCGDGDGRGQGSVNPLVDGSEEQMFGAE